MGSLFEWAERHPRWVTLLVGLLAFAASALAGLGVGVREPEVHDEYAYLLGADTFAQGRMTNPSHPSWIHLETFHVIQRPSYQMRFPPGQSLLLAVGQRLGHPMLGVWLGSALLCTALVWMLRALFPLRWALLGGILAILRFSIAGYWAQSYWGGALAGAGGALVLGALARVFREEPRPLPGALLGLGLTILAFTRPFEGLLFALPCAAVLAWRFLGTDRPAPRQTIRFLLPAAGILLLGAGFLGTYNQRVTGHPLRLPQQVFAETYEKTPSFVWQQPRDGVEWNHPRMEQFHTGWQYDQYLELGQPGSWFLIRMERIWKCCKFFLGFWMLALIPAIGSWQKPWLRFAALLSLFLLLSTTFLTTWAGNPLVHYLAPMTGAVLVLVVEGLRVVWHTPALGRWGRVPLLLLIVVLTLAELGGRLVDDRQAPDHWAQIRRQLEDDLVARGGSHLVIVEYEHDYSVHQEWVYNRADIDTSPVVWARGMNEARALELITSFAPREAWLLQVHDSVLGEELRPHPLRRASMESVAE